MKMNMLRILVLLLLLFTRSVSSDTLFGVEVPDSYVPPEPKEVKELPLALPQPPAETGLLEFDVSESFNFRYYIDPASLSFGDDGIMRYTAVIISKMGAKTIVYEGMKCWGQEAKRYADLDTYSGDPQWRVSKKDDWQVISLSGRNNYRGALYNDYFCHSTAPMRTVSDMIKSLKKGGYESTETPTGSQL